MSAHLRTAESFHHHMLIAGGAALALRWEDRVTSDVDILEHRFRRPTAPGEQRLPTAVDFISMRLPADLERAVARVTQAKSLPWNCLNGAAAIFTPSGDLQAEVVYLSTELTVASPGPSVLLAMKLHAGRDRDLADAVRLMHETRVSESERLLELVAEAYGEEAVTARTERFVAAAVTSWRERPSRARHPAGRSRTA